VLGVLMLATWELTHGYRGLFHDAGLYTLQAMARLHSDTLSTDAFLKYGSQDRFTLWSPLYAAVIRRLGVEPAAAVLTAGSQILLLLSAWALAREVLPPRAAWLGLGVLIAIPGNYGADQIFSCIEPFLTPRMLAEAFVLLSTAAALRGRVKWAVGGLLMAGSLHPLMAMAGIGALYCLTLGESKPVVAVALAIVALKAMALWAYAMPLGPWGRFDGRWLALVETRSPNLFLRGWDLDDWARLGVTLATLGLGWLALPDGRARRLAKVSAITGVAGIALTGWGCDLLHLVLFTQLQPWRCQWLATVVAALLLPQLTGTLWRANAGGRAALGLLLAAWLFASNAFALVTAAAALLAWVGTPHLKPGEARLVGQGAAALLALAGVWLLASNLLFTGAHYFEPSVPLWLRDSMSFARDGDLPIALLLVTGWLAGERRALARLTTGGLGLAALSSCAILTPQAWSAWTAREFPEARVAQFAEWRKLIPPQASVFWPESPLAVWLLLDRASYLSVLQTSGMVFSRDSAREFERRATALSGAVSRDAFLDFRAGTGLNLSGTQLQTSCASGAFDYLVSASDLGIEPVAISTSGGIFRPLRLYRCGGTRGRG